MRVLSGGSRGRGVEIQGCKGTPLFARMLKVDFVTLKIVFKLFMLILATLDYNNTLVSTFNTILRFIYSQIHDF